MHTAATGGSVSGRAPNLIAASAPARRAPNVYAGIIARPSRSVNGTPAARRPVRSSTGSTSAKAPAVDTAGPSTPSSGVRTSASTMLIAAAQASVRPAVGATPAPTRKPGVTISAPYTSQYETRIESAAAPSV